MTQKMNLGSHVQPLKNVAALQELVLRLQNRQPGLPGMATFYGPTGWGKSMAAAFVRNECQAIYVKAELVWTKKSLLKAILRELNVPAKGTIADMFDDAKNALKIADRTLLIDEADYLVQQKTIPIMRDLHDGADVDTVLIGEEGLPQKLKQWERVSGRMLDWVAAQPIDMRDAKLLAVHYAPNVDVEEIVLERLIEDTAGSARLISVQLAHFAESAKVHRVKAVSMDQYPQMARHKIAAPLPRLEGLAPVVQPLKAVGSK